MLACLTPIWQDRMLTHLNIDKAGWFLQSWLVLTGSTYVRCGVGAGRDIRILLPIPSGYVFFHWDTR
uniref:Uncharacterized protein n=1 Tax=Picea glauca TaxID=3330 RepID=A0A101LZJ5_PICGL|nr:hypothetical protein ABT39_MTgene5269 [Picea glauca]QHR88803.1 hypothetical protein Q903MT_gene2819 [Picea sitchensis]